MKLQNDIRRALFIKGMMLFLRPFLWYGFFVFIVLYYVVFGKYEIRLTHIPVYLAFFAIVVPPISLGWIKIALSTLPFEGKVEEIIKTHEHVVNSVRKYEGDKGQIPVMHFKIRKPNGKLCKFSIRNPSFYDIDYIKQGDMVIHPFGCSFLEKAVKTYDRDVICLVCGTMSRMQCEICYDCRHSLSKRSAEYFLNS